ncbi:MAG TPA: MFS transporter [Candidatus Desulfovibrio gallistercoris]|nr:MFS transporter [Candidatus Desulfovibrio gallistercoris]
MTRFQQMLRILTLGLTFSASSALPYVHIKFYDVIREVTQTTNNELGLLMTVFTGVGMLLYIPGGLLADRCSARKLLAISLAIIALCNFFFAFYHTYTIALFIWGVLAVAVNMIGWSALIKAVRESGAKDEQGRVFGSFYGSTGIFSSVIGFVGAAVYGSVAVRAVGFQYMLIGQGIFALLALLGILLFVSDRTPYNEDVETPTEAPLRSALTVLRLPAVWLMVLLIFCGYGMYIGIGYMTPYTTNVLGISVTFGAVLGTIRAFGLRVFTGPFSGYISDKIGSTALVMIFCFCALVGMLVVLLLLPAGTSSGVIILMTLLFSFFGLVGFTIMFSCMEEVRIPAQYTGMAVSIISLLGYVPDGLFGPLFGYWLDRYGNGGYQVIFFFLIALSIVGALTSVLIYRRGRALRAAEGE